MRPAMQTSSASRCSGAPSKTVSVTRLAGNKADRRHHQLHQRAGRGALGEIELNVLVQAVVVTDDRRKAAEQVASRVPGLSVEDALSAPFLAIGTHDEIADHLVACRNRWGISYFSVRDHCRFRSGDRAAPSRLGRTPSCPPVPPSRHAGAGRGPQTARGHGIPTKWHSSDMDVSAAATAPMFLGGATR